MLTINTNKSVYEVANILKKYAKAEVKPVSYLKNGGQVGIYVGNIPVGGLSWEQVCAKEGLEIDRTCHEYNDDAPQDTPSLQAPWFAHI